MRFESDATVNKLFLLLAVCLMSLTMAGRVHAEDEPYEPNIAPASGEGEQAIGSFRAPEGFDIRLVAAEPNLANPVAFGIDEQGRFYVCETFRQGVGVEDNRKHMYWVKPAHPVGGAASRLSTSTRCTVPLVTPW